MALMFAICRPQPNWIPRNPKLMFQICKKASMASSMWGPPFARILPHGIARRSEELGGFSVREAQRAGERVIGGIAPHIDAPRGIQPMALDERHPETGERLTAPAHGRTVSVRAPGVLDLEAKQFMRP